MPQSFRSVRILLTADEAYPALERAFLAARTEIWASFPMFDLSTRLRSPEGLAIGKTWFDLVVHVLNRGVALNVVISDADPITQAALHRTATRQQRWFSAAAAVAEPGARLTVLRPRHPARTGTLVRVLIWPYMMKRLFGVAGWLNRSSPDHRTAALRDMDGIRQSLRLHKDGTVGVKVWSLPGLHPRIHHQKLAVIDRRLLYIGSLDIDPSQDDPPPQGCTGPRTGQILQLMIEGPVVAEAQLHLETFQTVIDGRIAPPKTHCLLRTMSGPGRIGPWAFGSQPLVSELRTAHLVLARRASRLIYLESHCFQDAGLAKVLADAARRVPGLRMILIVPVAPDLLASGAMRSVACRLGDAMQARALRILRTAFSARLFLGAPAKDRPLSRVAPKTNQTPPQGGPQGRLQGGPPGSVQARVAIFDQDAAIVSSADLTGRGLLRDTEAGVHITSRNDVIELRHRLMARWLPRDIGPDAFEDATALQAWAGVAWQNAATPSDQRHGALLLPYEFAAKEAIGQTPPIKPANFI